MIKSFENETVRALSWNQPYASMMLHGKIETRKRYTHVRGWVLICSCQKPYPQSMLFDISGPELTYKMKTTLEADETKNLNGFAIAIGFLSGCGIMLPSDQNNCYVLHRHNQLYCWVFENVQRIKPFPWNGKQGWSILTASQKEQIEII